MKTLLLLFLAAFSLSSFAQKKIKLVEVKDPVGDSVTEDTIYGINDLRTTIKTYTCPSQSWSRLPERVSHDSGRPELNKNSDYVFLRED